MQELKQYANTVKDFTRRICFTYPDARVKLEQADMEMLLKGAYMQAHLPVHLLFMMDHLQTFGPDERKIGSWMGWVAKAMDSTPCLGLATNQECRDLMRSDKPPAEWPRFLIKAHGQRLFVPLAETVKGDFQSRVMDHSGLMRPPTHEELQKINKLVYGSLAKGT